MDQTFRAVVAAGGLGGLVWTATANPDAVDTATTSVTFTAVPIGTAAADRLVVVGYSSQSAVATGMTIGGVTAAKAVEESGAISGLQIWYATVPTGTTADIVATSGGSMGNEVIVVGTLTGVVAAPTTATTGSDSVTITVPTGGIAVAFFYASPTDGTWSNATLDLTASDPALKLSPRLMFMVHTVTAGSQSPTYTSTGYSGHAVAAAWGP